MKIVGKRVHYFFWGADKDISEKRNFFVNRSVPKNFRRFLGLICKVDLTPDLMNLSFYVTALRW